jgi:hypothetical protein
MLAERYLAGTDGETGTDLRLVCQRLQRTLDKLAAVRRTGLAATCSR